MARLGSGGDVSIHIGTDYSASGIDGAQDGLKRLGETSESISERMQGHVVKLKAAWAGIAAVYLSTRWLHSAASDALDAEIHYNKLRVQVEGLGMAFKAVEPQIQAAIAASSKYALVQGQEVSKTLQELVFHSGDYNESLRRLNLTLDLAYQKGISTSEAAMLMGRAISGNTELLTRFLPELSNLDEKLGKSATEAERVAFVMAVLQEKTNGASREMTEHEKQIRVVSSAYNNLKQTIGDFLLFSVSTSIQYLKGPGEAFIWLRDRIDEAAAAINPYIILAKESASALMDYERAIRLVGSAHDKTAEQLAEAIRKESALRELRKKEQEAEEQRVRISEEQLVQLAAATLRLGASKTELMAIEALAFINAGANLEQLARYNQLLLEQTEREQAIALAKDAAGPQQDAQLEAFKAYQLQKQAVMDAAFQREVEYEDALLDRHLTDIAVRAQAEQSAEQQILNMKFAAGNQTVALMTLIGQKSQLAAVAALTLQKGLALAQVFISTKVAAARALAELGPIAGPPVAASISAWGHVQMALIAATGIAEAALGGGGSAGIGGGGGVGALPIVPPALSRADARPTQAISINIYNPLASQNWKEIVEDNIIPALNDAADRNISVTVRNM